MLRVSDSDSQGNNERYEKEKNIFPLLASNLFPLGKDQILLVRF